MKYRTRQEVLRAAADWMDVCEAAGVEAVCKIDGGLYSIKDVRIGTEFYKYEFPLALLEGKEVWVGSEPYYKDCGRITIQNKEQFLSMDKSKMSWNQPKPKTVMVEMLVEDAALLSIPLSKDLWNYRIESACRKALESLK